MSTQDIAADGYAAKHLAPADRGIGNAIQGGSFAFGVVVGGTLGLLLHHRYGWHAISLLGGSGPFASSRSRCTPPARWPGRGRSTARPVCRR